MTETGIVSAPKITASTLRFYIEYRSDNTTVDKGSVYITVKGVETDLSNYYTKTEVDNLETQLRQEIGGIDTRVTTLENATPGTGGNFNPVDPVTDNGQILVGSTDGTYSWSTQTIQELWNTADGANTKATTNTNSITALDTRVTTLEQNVATKSTFILLSDLYPTSNVQDGTYADYPYRFDYEVTGLTVNDVVEVILGLAAATSGNVAPITRSDAGKFSIYCKTDSSISDTINAIVFKGGN